MKILCGGGAWLGVISTIIPTVIVIWMIVDLYHLGFEFKMYLLFFLFFLFSFSMILLNLRMALFVPRDQPIRFNRKRQKIYIFEHHRKAWNPWVKWPTTVRV
ncbi:DUF6708 domain-containing protein, partial [Intestinirhabdus alba]|uniref:DUF6708 domain-containing protein n=1 Tax=Intestinirhabdus alba TaxID=2899544 RepID=UPI0038B29CB4